MKQYAKLEEAIEDAQIENHEKKLLENNEKELSEISKIIDKSDIEEEDKQRIIACIRREEFRGPLPHPKILQQYEEIQPGFAKEIMQMAVNEQGHRHKMESMIVESETSLNSGQLEVIRASIKLKSRLQVFGFVTTFLLVIVGVICIFLDKNVGSIVPFVLAIGSFCWTMFYGKKESSQGAENSEED